MGETLVRALNSIGPQVVSGVSFMGGCTKPLLTRGGFLASWMGPCVVRMGGAALTSQLINSVFHLSSYSFLRVLHQGLLSLACDAFLAQPALGWINRQAIAAIPLNREALLFCNFSIHLMHCVTPIVLSKVLGRVLGDEKDYKQIGFKSVYVPVNNRLLAQPIEPFHSCKFPR